MGTAVTERLNRTLEGVTSGRTARILGRRWTVLGGALLLALATLIGVGGFLSAPSEVGGGTTIGGPFRLTDQHGERVASADFAGRYMLVHFGYTFCPDASCPRMLSAMGQALEQLPPEVAERVVPVFITLDPRRDTVERLAEYLPIFHPRFVALTGTPTEVKAAARAYRVEFERVDGEPGQPERIQHSSVIYLMGPEGEYVAHFGQSAKAEDIAERLKKALGVTAPAA